MEELGNMNIGSLVCMIMSATFFAFTKSCSAKRNARSTRSPKFSALAGHSSSFLMRLRMCASGPYSMIPGPTSTSSVLKSCENIIHFTLFVNTNGAILRWKPLKGSVKGQAYHIIFFYILLFKYYLLLGPHISSEIVICRQINF